MDKDLTLHSTAAGMAGSSTGPGADRVTVWYDGECPLCVREIALMRRLDSHDAIDFVEARSAEGCPIGVDQLLARFHAREPGQPLVSGAAAFAAMWRAIPLLKPLGNLARAPAILWLLERAYLVFLRIRPGLQRLTRAVVSDG